MCIRDRVSARAAEERFRGLVESIEAIPYISEWDARGTIRYISPQVEAVLGYAPERWYAGADVWEDNLHPEDRERVLAASARTYTEQRDFACEYRMHAADGRVVWIAERETIVRDDTGHPLFCHGVMFAIPRTSGWVAQWLEMTQDDETKIARPRQIYTGERQRDYIPVDKRG